MNDMMLLLTGIRAAYTQPVRPPGPSDRHTPGPTLPGTEPPPDPRARWTLPPTVSGQHSLLQIHKAIQTYVEVFRVVKFVKFRTKPKQHDGILKQQCTRWNKDND